MSTNKLDDTVKHILINSIADNIYDIIHSFFHVNIGQKYILFVKYISFASNIVSVFLLKIKVLHFILYIQYIRYLFFLHRIVGFLFGNENSRVNG